METKPYIPISIRDAEMWKEVSEFLGIHPVVARLERMNWLGVDNWCQMVLSGKIKKDKLDLSNPFTPEEIKEKQKSWEKSAEERNFCDLIHYRLKQLVEVGGEIVCQESKDYCLSKAEYLTRGRRYKIESLSDDGFSEFTAITKTNANDKNTNYWSSLGILSLWRNGKEIYNWDRAYFDLWVEQNQDHPETEEMRAYCEEKAQYLSTGAERPDKYIIERHRKNMENPVYVAGFNAEENEENPYEFNYEISNQIMILAGKRYTTEEEKKEWSGLLKKQKDSEFNKWEEGYYTRRKYSYIK